MAIANSQPNEYQHRMPIISIAQDVEQHNKHYKVHLSSGVPYSQRQPNCNITNPR